MTAKDVHGRGHPEGVQSMDAPADCRNAGAYEPEGLSPIESLDWQARLQAAVEQALTKRAARRSERARLAISRRWGLVERHNTKLRRHHARAANLPTDEQREHQ